MASPSTEVLARCVGQMLEEAAFLFAAPAEIDPIPFLGSVIEAKIVFSGRHSGEICLRADEPLTAELAANLLGEEPSNPEVAVRGREALGELANMVAGALVVELFGKETHCRIGVPVIRTVDPKDRPPTSPRESCSVVFLTEEGRRLDVSLIITPSEG